MSAAVKWAIAACVFCLLLGAGIASAIAGSMLAHRAQDNAVRFAKDSAQSVFDATARAQLTAQGDSLRLVVAAYAHELQAVLTKVEGQAAVIASGKQESAALSSTLATLRTRADSFPVLLELTGSQARTIAQEDATIVDLQSANALHVRREAALLGQAAASDTLAQSWQRQAERWKQDADSMRSHVTAVAPRLLGFLPKPHFKPCAFAGVTTSADARMGVGACLVF